MYQIICGLVRTQFLNGTVKCYGFIKYDASWEENNFSNIRYIKSHLNRGGTVDWTVGSQNHVARINSVSFGIPKSIHQISEFNQLLQIKNILFTF